MFQQTGQIKESLEKNFDMPFVVTGGIQSGDPWFEISPNNDNNQELFKLNVSFKNATRIIIDFIPEKYSAQLLIDMSKASEERRLLFAKYAALLEQRKHAHIDFLINKTLYSPNTPEAWPTEWKHLACRITRSPVTSDDEDFDVVRITIEWAGYVLGMFLSLMHIISIDNEDQVNITGYVEGKSYIVETTRYERNPLNRQLCIALKGSSCSICGFNFSVTYGDIGNGYIEVHHVEPLSMLDTEQITDPIKDLIPVCPNCHSMLHIKSPPFLPDELRDMLKDR